MNRSLFGTVTDLVTNFFQHPEEVDWAVWGPPLLVFAVGLVIGFVALSRMKSPPADASIGRESRRIDMSSARDEVVEALKQLELDQDKLPPEDYARERDALVARGARALAALDDADGLLDEGPTAPVHPPSAAPAAGVRTGLAPEWRGALYALGAVLLLAVLWNLATSDTVERRDGASMTGNQDLGGAGEDPRAAVQESPRFKQRLAELEGKLAANANDVDALNDLTHMYMMVSDYPKAMEYNESSLKIEPTGADGRTYRAALTAMMSMPEKALEQFDTLLAEKPDHAMAIIYRAMVLFQTDRVDEALKALEVAAQKYPEKAEIQSAYQQARAAADEAAGGGAPPAAELLVSGTVTLDPASAATLKGSETLFVSIADPANPRPPIAAEKLTGPFTFPMPFALTTAHIRAMPGSGALPEKFDLKIKVDLDGNAMTQEPEAPSATVTGVNKGTQSLAVALAAGGATQAAPPGGLLAPLAPAAAPAAAPPAGVEVLAAGTADVDAKRKAEIAGSEVVFVSVRDPAGGPPLASKKVPARFPLQFQITSADIISMGGVRPIPETFNVTVRVDRDGNAMSKEGEPEALATGVTKGSAQLVLTLQ